jgi:hypothetical protein
MTPVVVEDHTSEWFLVTWDGYNQELTEAMQSLPRHGRHWKPYRGWMVSKHCESELRDALEFCDVYWDELRFRDVPCDEL